MKLKKKIKSKHFNAKFYVLTFKCHHTQKKNPFGLDYSNIYIYIWFVWHPKNLVAVELAKKS